MESSIVKLMKRYEIKVVTQETVISDIKAAVKSAEGREENIDYDDIRGEIDIARAKRQAYIQAIQDLKSLLEVI